MKIFLRKINKQRTKLKNKIFSALVVIAFGFTGCGGGGGGSAGTDTPATQTGTFIDAPVEGLEYSTPTLSGFTNANGEFQYKTGETITFKIGNLELGSATGGTTITPLTLAGDTDLNNIGTKATNIARILQTLDNNSTNGAKLVIQSSLRDLNISSSDFESDAVLNEILTKAQVKTSVAYTLKDSITAKAQMKSYINLYEKYPVLKSGITKKSSGTEYYRVSLSSNYRFAYGFNVEGCYGGCSYAYVYDTNLNPLYNSDGVSQLTLSSLVKQGNYIIKIIYGSSSEINIFSPSMQSIEELPSMTNGTYSGKGTKFYKLLVKENGNIQADFLRDYDASTWSYAYVYDTNLNPLYESGGVSRLSINNLNKAGIYVIKVIYGMTDNKLTITSNVLE